MLAIYSQITPTHTIILAMFLAIIGIIFIAIGAYIEQRGDYIRHTSDTKRRAEKRADTYMMSGAIILLIGALIL
jgi:archaellum biogenesis protein FlaJ (TadC family)